MKRKLQNKHILLEINLAEVLKCKKVGIGMFGHVVDSVISDRWPEYSQFVLSAVRPRYANPIISVYGVRLETEAEHDKRVRANKLNRIRRVEKQIARDRRDRKKYEKMKPVFEKLRDKFDR